jgi:uncharacterized protein YqcC (DUF446 family)
MADSYVQLASVLMDLECELRSQGLWQAHSPAPEALASTQPFAVDTLNFPQWLQFIFIPRLHALAEARAVLPDACGVAPMAEEYFRPLPISGESVILHLRIIDQLLSR